MNTKMFLMTQEHDHLSEIKNALKFMPFKLFLNDDVSEGFSVGTFGKAAEGIVGKPLFRTCSDLNHQALTRFSAKLMDFEVRVRNKLGNMRPSGKNDFYYRVFDLKDLKGNTVKCRGCEIASIRMLFSLAGKYKASIVGEDLVVASQTQ